MKTKDSRAALVPLILLLLPFLYSFILANMTSTILNVNQLLNHFTKASLKNTTTSEPLQPLVIPQIEHHEATYTQETLFPKIFISKIYPNVTLDKGKDYYFVEDGKPECAEATNFILHEEIGSGKYSNVYNATSPDGKLVCVKQIKLDREKRINREIKILEILRGGPGIVDYMGCYQNPMQNNQYGLVFELLESRNWKTQYAEFSLRQIQLLMTNLLKAIDFAHSKGIIHRDIKPSNMIFHPETSTFRLLDWGLSEFYHHGHQKSIYVASRYYKPPEILLEWEYYDYAFDLWSVGCVFGALVFGSFTSSYSRQTTCLMGMMILINWT